MAAPIATGQLWKDSELLRGKDRTSLCGGLSGRGKKRGKGKSATHAPYREFKKRVGEYEAGKEKGGELSGTAERGERAGKFLAEPKS